MDPFNIETSFQCYGYKCLIKHVGYTMSKEQKQKREALEMFGYVPNMDWFCGYVIIPEGHPLYGKHYSDLYDTPMDICVHGGVTFTDKTEHGWMIGFDCNHSMDTPEIQDFEFTKQEIIKMVEQIRQLENNNVRLIGG